VYLRKTNAAWAVQASVTTWHLGSKK